jgi:1-aminocyclopropane-1-carboxylate deaminase
MLSAFDEFWHPAAPIRLPSREDVTRLYNNPILPLRSRCRPFAVPGQGSMWIKRDDELSFGASGSKVRKYSSLVPALLDAGIEHAVVLGGRNSNNVIAAAQLLTEFGITCHLLLREPVRPGPDCVFELVRHLIPEHRIHHVERAAWQDHAQAALTLQQHLSDQGKPAAIVPEGGSRVEALAGAMTLGLDITRNEGETGATFTDILIEAGTGLTAIGLALGLATESTMPRKLHILRTTVPSRLFTDLYRNWTASAGPGAPSISLYDADSTPHAMRDAHLSAIGAVSRATGILFDPHYSGQLLDVIEPALRSGAVGERLLFVHTGGMGLLSALEADRNDRSSPFPSTDNIHCP